MLLPAVLFKIALHYETSMALVTREIAYLCTMKQRERIEEMGGKMIKISDFAHF